MRKIALLQNSGASEGFAVFFPAFMSMSPRCLVHAVIDTGCCLEQNGLTLLQRASGVTLEGTTTGLTLRFGLVIGIAIAIRLRNLREIIAYKIGLRNKKEEDSQQTHDHFNGHEDHVRLAKGYHC